MQYSVLSPLQSNLHSHHFQFYWANASRHNPLHLITSVGVSGPHRAVHQNSILLHLERCQAHSQSLIQPWQFLKVVSFGILHPWAICKEMRLHTVVPPRSLPCFLVLLQILDDFQIVWQSNLMYYWAVDNEGRLNAGTIWPETHDLSSSNVKRSG